MGIEIKYRRIPMLNQRMARIKETLVRQSVAVESMVEVAIRFLNEPTGDPKTAIANYESEVDHCDSEIDEQCLTTVALFHPEARDLRKVMMYFRINGDLERIGDMAENLAGQARRLRDLPLRDKVRHQLPIIAEKSGRMIHDGLAAFFEEDVAKALAVHAADDEVDELNRAITRSVIAEMTSGELSGELGVSILKFANLCERMGDLVTNIAESTVFISDGRTLKHQPPITEE
jgi:phosphate transport system protein